jgi:hypothetical protein
MMRRTHIRAPDPNPLTLCTPSWIAWWIDSMAVCCKKVQHMFSNMGCWKTGKQLVRTTRSGAIGTTHYLLMFSFIEQCVLLFFRSGTQCNCIGGSPPTMPCPPQLIPQPPVQHPKTCCATAMSSLTCLLTTVSTTLLAQSIQK